jgi:hypothetical protein
MSPVPFYTSKFTRNLEEPGLAASIAAGAAEAPADTNLATKDNFVGVKYEIASVRPELKEAIPVPSTEFQDAIERFRRDITIKFSGAMIISVGILLVALRYLRP